MLPLKSGDRVMQELREFSELPVIVLSAKDMIQTKIQTKIDLRMFLMHFTAAHHGRKKGHFGSGLFCYILASKLY